MISDSAPAPPGPTDFPLRLAAIDIGSNALRFAVADFSGPEDFRLLESRRVPVRLGHSAFRNRRLEPERIDRAVAALATFRQRLDHLAVRHHRAVATSAVRESENGSELIDRVRTEIGILVEPITGAEEGRLVWRAIRARVPLRGRRWLLADLGGGSLELSLAESERLRWTQSLALGTVRLLEELGGEQNGADDAIRALIEAYVASADIGLPPEEPVEAVIATGGNADILADLAAVPADERGIRRLTRAVLCELIDRIAALSFRERIERLNLREDRADVILPAAIVYEQVARIAQAETILVPGVGLKEGVLLDLLDDLSSHASRESRLTAELEAAAIALGRRYLFDEAHAQQVMRLVLKLYDALEELHGLGEADRRILMAAAILHDAGKFISARKHHKHARYLIRHAELPGLSGSEVNLAALVARYHRGARPKKSQKAFGNLEAKDRKRVKKLAALLRVGDALDRDHAQEVREISVAPGEDEVTLHVSSGGDPLLEDWSLQRKGKLFERVYGRRLRVLLADSTATPR